MILNLLQTFMASLPQHITFIPDGNRRWALGKSVDFETSYIKGMETIEQCIKYAVSKKIPFISFFVLAHENKKRSPEWKFIFFTLLKKYLRPKCEAMFAQNIGVQIIGDLHNINHIKEDVQFILEKNPKNTKMQVIFFLNYSGSFDLEQAVQQLLSQNDKPCHIKNYLQTRQVNIPDPDLLIRTSDSGNVKRLSDFMMVQCANTELYFSEKLWPDFTEDDFEEALKWYGKVERRFGK